MAYKTILLCIKGKGDETRVIDEAMQIAADFDAALSILVVNDPGAGKAHMMMDTLPRITADDVHALLDKAGYADKRDDIRIITIDDESHASAIAEQSQAFDLLVMGHHPKNPFIAALKDSTDERVADRIQCPVLLVPLND